MCRASKGHKYILVVADEVKHYLVTLYMYTVALHEIAEAFINNGFRKHGPHSFFDEAFL